MHVTLALPTLSTKIAGRIVQVPLAPVGTLRAFRASSTTPIHLLFLAVSILGTACHDQCKKGGLIIHRHHDAINYELANLMRLAFKKSVVRAEPRIFNGSPATNFDNASPTVEASGERGAECQGNEL